MYNIKIFKSIYEIDRLLWDSIPEEDKIICKYDFVRSIEESHINDCEFYYFLIYDNEELIAHTWIYTMSMDLVTQITTQPKSIFAKIINKIRKVFPKILIIKIIECGSPIALGNIITINMKENCNKEEIVKIIINSMIKIGREKKARLLIIRDFYKKDIALGRIFKKSGLALGYNLPDVDMINKWKNFEEYINNLRYNYRRFYKKCNSKLYEEGITIEYLKDYNIYVPKLLELYKNCYNHAREYRRELLTEDFFYKTQNYVQDKIMVILLKKDNEVIGFAYFLLDDLTARLLYVGMDYNTKEEYMTYFNIFFLGLKFAMDNNFKKIELGVTTYEFKLKLGGEIITQYGFFKHLNPVFNFILKKFSKIIFPKKKIVERHPFKKES